MSVFDTAAATLAADPNLGIPVSYQALAGGDPLSINAILLTPEDLSRLGFGLDVVSHGKQFAVQVSDIPAPQPGDTITIAAGAFAGAYTVQGAPAQIMLARFWKLDTAQ